MSDHKTAIHKRMTEGLSATIYRAIDEAGAAGVDRIGMALNAMAYAAGIAAGVMEEGGRGKISAATLLSAVLESDIVSGGIDHMAQHGRPQ